MYHVTHIQPPDRETLRVNTYIDQHRFDKAKLTGNNVTTHLLKLSTTPQGACNERYDQHKAEQTCRRHAEDRPEMPEPTTATRPRDSFFDAIDPTLQSTSSCASSVERGSLFGTRVAWLQIRDHAGGHKNCFTRYLMASALDATLKIFFERLYLVPEHIPTCALYPHSLRPHPHRSLHNYFWIFVQIPVFLNYHKRRNILWRWCGDDGE